MQPTTITTMLLIAFGVGLIAMTIRLYFGSWEPPRPRRAPTHPYDPRDRGRRARDAAADR